MQATLNNMQATLNRLGNIYVIYRLYIMCICNKNNQRKMKLSFEIDRVWKRAQEGLVGRKGNGVIIS